MKKEYKYLVIECSQYESDDKIIHYICDTKEEAKQAALHLIKNSPWLKNHYSAWLNRIIYFAPNAIENSMYKELDNFILSRFDNANDRYPVYIEAVEVWKNN